MYSINQITFNGLHKHSLHDTYIQWTGETCINHTAAILVKTIDFPSLGSPCSRFEASQNVANKGFYSHGNKHGGGGSVITAH